MSTVILVWVALLAVTVMFGMAALVVDVGYGMSQVRAMQNGADAGALAAAKLLAGSAALGAGAGGSTTVYVVTDGELHAKALDLVDDNRPSGLGSSDYRTAVRYVPCPGQTDGTPNFTAQSDATLVAELSGTRLDPGLANTQGIGSSPNWNWPSPICGVRVYARVIHAALFAQAPPIGQTTEAVTARATARVFPTNPPTLVSNVWPITHWSYNSAACVFSPGNPCTFWDSNPQPNGNFKELVDFSRYSQLALNRNPSITRSQLFNCAAGGFGGPCWDQTYPGNNGKLVDPPNWIANGWRGMLYVNEADPTCSNPAQILQQCQNSRLEVYEGNMGNNISSQMTSYINTYGSLDQSCNCMGATVVVFFWRYGEVLTGQQIDTTNQGTIWGASANPNSESGPALLNGRIILQKVRNFRFNTSTVSASSVRGYFVSFFNSGPPLGGPPSTVANTVGLVD